MDLDFYRSLIPHVTKRISLETNNLLEFVFNTSIQRFQWEPQFYVALAQVELTDRITSNIQDGSFRLFHYELTVRVNRLQYEQSFDKYLIMVKLSDEFFDHEQMLIDEIDESLL